MQTLTNDVDLILFASARASAHFALACLEPYRGHLRAFSSFVNPRAETMHWHDFGDLEGPGWAANSAGGAHLLYRWGAYVGERTIQERALALLDHLLEDGFVDWESGFIWPYYELAQQRFCLNYVHKNDWLCPGSLARIGSQLLLFADDLGSDPRAGRMRQAARRLGEWLQAHVPLLPNGWVPRRVTAEGQAFPLTPDGRPDPIFGHSADGLFLLQLWIDLTERGLGDHRAQAIGLGEAFVAAGGFWGSLNHDTYDDHEDVAYAVAFRTLRQGADLLDRPAWRRFAHAAALPALARYRMAEDRNGVRTKGLLWMEETWDTAYLWENAEVAQAYLEAWTETGDQSHRAAGVEILAAIARHHTGPLGFLTEGIDWNNHVTRRHHIREALYGDICYTEPLLNNLHLLGPTLFYFEHAGYHPQAGSDDRSAIALVSALELASRAPIPGAEGAVYLLRLYYPALATEERVAQSLEFVRASGVDGVLLFESSYDMDPALLTPDVLAARFARLKEIVPRFRELVREVDINVMITVGHVDMGSARPERFPFQFLVDQDGNLSRSTACPLDPAFLAYAADLYRLAGECGADVVWVDDDTRFPWHDVPGVTCFCPHHLAAIAERTGRTWTREELVAVLLDDESVPPIRRAWFDVQEEVLLGLARTVERAVHAVAPETGIGLMTVGTACHALEGRHMDRLLRTLAGSGRRPLIRPGSGFYFDTQPLGVLEKSEDCARQVGFLNEDVRAVAEVENHPYTPYGKSLRVLALELGLNVLAGMPDLSLNLLTSMGGSGPLEPEGTSYATFLRAERPFLDALARERAGKLRRGIGIADTEEYARSAALHGQPLSAWLQRRPWEPLLARFGFPIGRPDQAPHWVAGEVLRSLSAYDLGQYLREGAVFDPIAAQVLLDRGYGARLGLRSVRAVRDGVNEFLTDDPLNCGRGGQAFSAYNHISPEQLYSFDLEPQGSRVLSRWINVDGEDRGIAAALAERDGLRAGFLPFALQSTQPALLNIARREQWAALLTCVSGRALPCRIVSGVNLYPLALVDPDDGDYLFAVANLSADDAEATLEVSALADRRCQVERLGRDGGWQAIAGPEDHRLSLAVPAFSLAAVRCRAA